MNILKFIRKHPIKVEGLKGLIKKPWFWLVIGGIALLAFVMRKKGAAANAAVGQPDQAYRIAGQGMASSAADQASVLDQFLTGMQLKQAQQQSSLSDFQYQQTQAENSLYSKLFNAYSLGGKEGQKARQALKGSGVQCPSGKMRIDPNTMTLYCRESQGGGFFSGINARDLINAASTVFTATRGTTRVPTAHNLESTYLSRRPGTM
jgi:hypothetical protein